MTAFIPNLDREEFRKWLSSLVPSTKVGTPGDCCNCPVARWIVYQAETALPELAHLVGAFVGPRTISVRVDDVEVTFPTPEWVKLFTERVDSDFKDYEFIYAREALELI
jgi:hypothetical protein